MIMPTRWAGIDEAGYGPNLGPLVMTAVVAESPDARPPDVWSDLAPHVSRASGGADQLWIDDSKAVYRAGVGRDRLESACLAVLEALELPQPISFGSLLNSLGAGSFDDVELTPWLDDGDPTWPSSSTLERHEPTRLARPFSLAPWRLVSVHTVVIGPAHFNRGLAENASKARVHHHAFTRLLRPIWDGTRDGVITHVRSDKHGGRHFYQEPLAETFPGLWIERGVEGPALSRYKVIDGARRLEIGYEPRADASDGLVALASLVSKGVREFWMESFNAHWSRRIPGLKPTAGYPVDAARFRKAIEPHCLERELPLNLWWRAK